MKYILLILCYSLPLFSQQSLEQTKKLSPEIIDKKLQLIQYLSEPSSEIIVDHIVDYASITLDEIIKSFNDENYTIIAHKNNFVLTSCYLVDKNFEKILPEVREFLKNNPEYILRVQEKDSL